MLSSVSKPSSIRRSSLRVRSSLPRLGILLSKEDTEQPERVSSCVLRHLPQVYDLSQIIPLHATPSLLALPPKCPLQLCGSFPFPVFLFAPQEMPAPQPLKFPPWGHWLLHHMSSPAALWCLLGISRCPAEIEPCRPERWRATVGSRRAKCSS